MAQGSIDYGRLMQRAVRELIREVLIDVAENGLPGDHHFYITFDTSTPNVQIADWLQERYPEEMTVIIQAWFRDLVVDEDGFSVTLNFGDQPEPLYIPFAALRTFADPSVEFGFRFEAAGADSEEASSGMSPGASDDAPMIEVEAPEREDAEIVSLDSFRKN